MPQLTFYRKYPKDDGRLSFHRRLSIHIWGGGGLPHPRSGGEGTPSQVWMGGGGTPS